MKSCSIDGCERRADAKGMCQRCYLRWRRGTLGADAKERNTRNPAGPRVFALAFDGSSIASIREQTGLNKNTVIGLLWRRRGDLAVERMIETMAARYPGFPRNPFPDRGGCLFPNAYEPRDPRFAFCGSPVSEPGGSWCAGCRKRVYHTIRPA